MQHNKAFLAIVQQARADINELSTQDVEDMLAGDEDFLLIDVREDGEWAQGHLPKATHLSKGIIERDIETKVKDKASKIVVYCGGGYRSALAAVNLQKMGYKNVYSMWGGFRHWREEGRNIIG